MNSMEAYARGLAAKGNRRRVFDWHKAADLIRESKAQHAMAGLAGDMEYTEGCILDGGLPDRDSYTYLASTWATPVLILDDGDEIDCWIYEGGPHGWDEMTKWPESAVARLSAPVQGESAPEASQ
jgi:hypothetical protein